MASPHDLSRVARFAPDPKELERLLAEARAHRGESLWQDALRRLRRNRGAWWSFLFVIVFVGASFLAPLLPLPSPMALDLQEEPQPPRWPWAENPRAAPVEGKKPAFGAGVTRNLASLADDGWQHRTFVDVALPLPLGATEPAADAEIAALVERVSGRDAQVHVRPGDTPGTLVQRHAIVQRAADRVRRDWRPAGERAIVAVALAQPEAGPAEAWLEVTGALDLERVSSLAARTYAGGLELVLVTRDAPDEPRRYRLAWRAASDARIAGLVVDGVALPPDARRADDGTWTSTSVAEETATLDDGSLPEVTIEPSVAPDDELVLVRGGRTLVLGSGLGMERLALESDEGRHVPFERRTEVVDAEVGIPHDDLGRRVAAELEASGRGSLAGLEHTDGIWELGGFDGLLLAARARLFGLWQTGPLLGTDAKGRDVFARIVWGSRISIQVSVVATLCSLLIGVTWGAFAGLMGGRVDNLMMRIVDVLYSVPFIFVVIFLITIINEYRTELADRGIGYMTVFYVVIGAIYWLTMARVVRGQVLSLKNQEFVEAARVLGASTPRILFAHLVPNVLSVVIVYLTLTIPAVMLFEAFLSFLGLGVEPPRVSWGLLAVDATDSISAVVIYWWLIVFPSLAMGSVLLALNVLGDGLRDALDPKLRGKD